MYSLKQFFITLFVICILSAICEILTELSPTGSSSALKLICGLALLVTIASAIFSGCQNTNASLKKQNFDTITDSNAYNPEYSENIIIEKTQKQLERDVSSAIFEKYGIKTEDVSIEFSTEKNDGNTEVNIKNASIRFSEDSDKSSIAESLTYLEELFGTAFAEK